MRKPQIGDTRPAPAAPAEPARGAARPRQGERGQGSRRPAARERPDATDEARSAAQAGWADRRARAGGATTVAAELTTESRRGRERNGKPVGRYLMCVQVRPDVSQVAVLEGRNLIEHYVSRPADDISQIHGNIYLGRVQNVLPGMEAAFVDIATPKNAVLYRGDVQYDAEDIEERSEAAAHRGHPARPSADRLPGHEEPDRRQGRPAHPGGVAARAVRRADPELQDLRHLQAPARRRAQAPAGHPRPGEAGPARAHRAHGCRARHRSRAARRHDPAARAVGADRGSGGVGQAADAALPRAGAGGARDPRGVQRRLPRGGHRRPSPVRGGARRTSAPSIPSSPTASSSTTPRPTA